MTTTRIRSRLPAPRLRRFLLCVPSAMLVAIVPFVAAQATPATTPSASLSAANLSLQLPDSPGSLFSSSVDTPDTTADPAPSSDDPQAIPRTAAPPPNARTKHSVHLGMTIAPNEIIEPMSVHDEVVGGLKHSVSLFSVTGWVASAGWTQLTNGSPNYGTDKGAFGQRLGAAAVRNISEGVFSRCLFAPVFREDPRYYIMGRSNNIFKRTLYAATRTIVTRTNSGHATPNLALLAGNAAGAALTATYYPAKNTTSGEVAKTFGASVGGSAVGFIVTEFIADALEYAHLSKRD